MTCSSTRRVNGLIKRDTKRKQVFVGGYDVMLGPGGGARAARSFALLGLVGEPVEDFEEGSLGAGDAVFAGVDFGVLNSEGGVGAVAGAAGRGATGGTEFFLFGAAGLFASELALGL
eukprot:CAMPEP_0175143048 /NCGR_PEP_ID=MMETSP0087-20121206/13190_1 /TAXON_ID=136419 /ORGANISM="Unknown Unknown, Strain D1" /LENGTH=116 /DNA_ID=CAMNT_0016427023 /DNA_START=200 /DNA_END=547 /DNA_ORIENTATION=+